MTNIRTITKAGHTLVLALVFICAACTPIQAQTENSYTVLAPLPCIESPADASGQGGVTCDGGSGTLQQTVDFKSYVQYTFNLFIALSAVAAVFMIVWGGFEYMTSDAIGDKKDGKEKVIHAFQGLLLVLCSYLILRTIDPRFVEIPEGLVAPLNIKIDPKYTAAGFFESVMNETANFNLAAQTAVDNAKKTKGDIQALIETRSLLCNQLSTAASQNSTSIVSGINTGMYKDECAALVAQAQKLGVPAANALAIQIAKIDSDIVSKKAEVIIGINNSIMDNGGVAAAGRELNKLRINDANDLKKIDDVVKSSTDFISSTAKKAKDQLAAEGAYDQQEAIDQKAKVDKFIVYINGIGAKAASESSAIWYLPGIRYVSGSGILGFNSLSSYKKALNTDLDFYEQQLPSISNGPDKDTLKAKIDSVRNQINNLK